MFNLCSFTFAYWNNCQRNPENSRKRSKLIELGNNENRWLSPSKIIQKVFSNEILVSFAFRKISQLARTCIHVESVIAIVQASLLKPISKLPFGKYASCHLQTEFSQTNGHVCKKLGILCSLGDKMCLLIQRWKLIWVSFIAIDMSHN